MLTARHGVALGKIAVWGQGLDVVSLIHSRMLIRGLI